MKWFIFLCSISSLSFAELTALDDQRLSEIDGEGLGIVLEDFVFDVDDAVTTLSGIDDSEGDPIEVKWTEFYVMGNGSNKGSVETVGQIGTLAHPITLRALDYLDVPSAPDGVAILQLAGPDYTGDALNNTEQYALWKNYMPCQWGEAGCNDTNASLANINSEISALGSERTNIQNSYADFSVLRSGIDTDLAVVEVRQADLDQKIVAAAPYKDAQQIAAVDMQSKWGLAGEPGNLGEKVWCIVWWCTSGARGSYNDSVDTFEDRNDDLAPYNTAIYSAQQDLGEAWNETRDGKTLLARLGDYERYEVLCGKISGNDRSCDSGLIIARGENKDDITLVIAGMNNGDSRRGGLDIGSKFEFQVYDATKGSYRTDYLDFDMTGVTADGSFLRLWSQDDNLNGELQIKLYAETLDISTCGIGVCTDAATIFAKDVFLNVALGYGKHQPLQFSVTPDGQFQIELPKITKQAVDEGFYLNAPKTDILVGNLNLGGNNDLGGITVRGLSNNYLKVTSHDL